ncbi:MAG: ATP-dependent zinc metalloprotease FtsH [Deltaproteobacteria bacterium]|nr:ATP-dependent zinc metalloprotease FtsH [Deltaproteobacteria bacterium]
MKQSFKNLIVWVLFIVLFIVIVQTLQSRPDPAEMGFSEFIRKALPAEGQPSEVAEITVKGDEVAEIEGKLGSGETFRTLGDVREYQKDLVARGVEVKYLSTDGGLWQLFLVNLLPILVLGLLFFAFIRQAQSGGGRLFNFGKSRHRILSEDARRVTFQDIAGIEEAKEELHEIIEFLKDAKKFTRLGGRIPKGVLLMGPTGTGKTLLARGVAGEAGVPFFSISGSDFVEMFVGVGAARVRDLFEQGKKRAPCIIFIDEIDAVGRQRGTGLGGGHDEREQTLNQLLVEMDGFEPNAGVIIMAATNRPDVLDPALLRPGRFDRRIVVPSPDVRGREAILGVHTRKVPLGKDVDLAVLSRGTPGFVGADLENMVNEAALLAARKSRDEVTMADFEEAKDKILLGVARKSAVMSEHERELTAHHEAGHTIVAKSVPGADPIHKVTIIPRGMSLGQTHQLPVEDRYTISRGFLLDRLAIAMGGRAAEMIVFGEETTGAGQDIKMATDIARRMVAQWGMSVLGPVHMDQREDMVFLGRELTTQRETSEATAQRVDREIKRLILDAHDRATEIIRDRFRSLKDLAAALLEKESLDGNEVDAILARSSPSA